MNETLTIKEVAEYLGVHHNTVRQYIKRGILPAFRWGGFTSLPPNSKLPWRIKKIDLERFANGQRNTEGI